MISNKDYIKEEKEKIFSITLFQNISELRKEIIVELFCDITSLKESEEKKGNTIDKAFIKLKYTEDLTVIENINIFKLINSESLYEYIKYFKKFKEKFSEQNRSSRADIDDYINEKTNVSQKIEIHMLFNISSSKEEKNERKKIIMESIKLTSIDDKIWKKI